MVNSLISPNSLLLGQVKDILLIMGVPLVVFMYDSRASQRWHY